jgi:hypothetical protein
MRHTYKIELTMNEFRAIETVASWGYCEALLDALDFVDGDTALISEVDAWGILAEIDTQDGEYTAHFGPELAAKIERLISEFV